MRCYLLPIQSAEVVQFLQDAVTKYAVSLRVQINNASWLTVLNPLKSRSSLHRINTYLSLVCPLFCHSPSSFSLL